MSVNPLECGGCSHYVSRTSCLARKIHGHPLNLAESAVHLNRVYAILPTILSFGLSSPLQLFQGNTRLTCELICVFMPGRLMELK